MGILVDPFNVHHLISSSLKASIRTSKCIEFDLYLVEIKCDNLNGGKLPPIKGTFTVKVQKSESTRNYSGFLHLHNNLLLLIQSKTMTTFVNYCF